jgi:hypothetical protein
LLVSLRIKKSKHAEAIVGARYFASHDFRIYLNTQRQELLRLIVISCDGLFMWTGDGPCNFASSSGWFGLALAGVVRANDQQTQQAFMNVCTCLLSVRSEAIIPAIRPPPIAHFPMLVFISTAR